MELLNLARVTLKQDQHFILNDISFTQNQFKKIAIVGETGAGKTTLLKIIAGLIQPGSGQVLFKNEKVPGPDEKLIPGHPGIVYISQHFELRNNYKVEEELAYTNQLTSEQAADIFEICRIGHLLKRWTDELSGGEKQLIVTARALIAAPGLLLLDEPFSNLDMAHKHMMKAIINDITEKLKITCILVSHDPMDILPWADEILVLENGKLIQQGAAKQIYLQPVNEYTAALFGKYNLIRERNAGFFSAFPGNHIPGKDMLIRPEHFKILDGTSKPFLHGIIKKITWFGSYLEIEVLAGGMTILLTQPVSDFAVGDEIYFSPRMEAICYL